MSKELQIRLNEIEAKIQRENSVLQGFKTMMCAHSKRDLRSQCEDGIRQSETILAFFRSEREKLRELMIKQETMDIEEMVAFRMQEIQHKLIIEERVLEAVNKFNTTAANDKALTSRESQQQARLKWFDSSEKARIYSLALRELKPLVLEAISSSENSEENVPTNPGIRQPISGALTIKVLAEQNLAYSEDCEISILLQIDGTTRGQPFKVSTGDRRVEHFREEVFRGNEMEMLVVAQGRDRGSLIGLLWIPLNEVVDELRKRAQGSTGWAPADPTGWIQAPLPHPDDGNPIVIEDWFKLEPAGKLLLRIGFDKHTGPKRVKSGLGRQGAVRKGKRQVVVSHMGHQFEHRQVYRPLTCPVCRKFAINATELQCQDCSFFCHAACVQLVRAKCITSSGQMRRRSLNQIYNIPHRFEGSVGLAAHWCCHCGKMLLFVGSSARRCVDCDLACHTSCQHLVPNFCGMTQEMACQLLGFNQPQPPASPSFNITSPPLQPPKSPLRSSMLPPAILIPPQLPLSPKSAPASPSPAQTEFKTARVEPSLADYKLLAVLGRGNFGKVLLAETRTTRKVVAVKILKKDAALQKEEVEALQNEKKVFILASQANHPFLVRLHACFQTPGAVVFVMDYVIGGDLMSLIQRRRSFLPDQARFYCAEIVLALEFLHSQDIIYRDLKLDNVLLDASGHIKVADYGLCKMGMGYGKITTTFCGTPEFMAPEILEEQKYGRAVDWWSLGVLLYQMVLGQSPFTGSSELDIFESILEDEVLFPPTLPRATVSILQKLITRDPTLRLGGGPKDAAEVKAHDYFRNVDWVAYANCEVRPPYIPLAADPTDTANFDNEFTAQPATITPSNSLLSPSQQDRFKDFSFVADWPQN